ncbi:tyrosine-type recombinase/integrase [Solicola gregarius]|uniref:Site-specific integrase n=1 Tax=Solicola gregarius TaxID=2908642 RepID=A0AA46YMU3_9ACTN|nr:tyrosine-type recombinase/integrase [Solicola gregarius]UYM06073.1 site-specific integrase [Solicola gregarius]
MTRATTAKLAPGEDTIDRSTPKKKTDGSWRLQWTMVLPNGQKFKGDNTGATKGEARRRARSKADELRRSGGGAWKTTDQLTTYIEKTSKPTMAKADLSDLTRRRYDLALRWLVGDCDRHKHRHSLKHHTIASGIKFKPLEDLLTEIARDHGLETAKQCRTVLTKYVITRLVRDELITGNPIGGVRLEELTGMKRGERTRGGKAITSAQVEAVLDHLLGLDPAEGYTRRQGRWNAATVAKRRNAIDQLLLQLATGLRSTEANRLDWSLVDLDDQDVMHIDVTKDIAKGGVPRVVLVLQQRVAERLLERRKRAEGKGYVIGSPADPMKVWEARNRNKAAAALYQELAEELGIEVMANERSHMWRTTLRSHYDGKAPAAVLNSQFGHSEKTAQKHYTDASDLSGLASAAGLHVV